MASVQSITLVHATNNLLGLPIEIVNKQQWFLQLSLQCNKNLHIWIALASNMFVHRRQNRMEIQMEGNKETKTAAVIWPRVLIKLHML